MHFFRREFFLNKTKPKKQSLHIFWLHIHTTIIDGFFFFIFFTFLFITYIYYELQDVVETASPDDVIQGPRHRLHVAFSPRYQAMHLNAEYCVQNGLLDLKKTFERMLQLSQRVSTKSASFSPV